MAMPAHEMDTDPSNISSPPDDMANPKPTLDLLFSKYPIQTAMMRHLNLYDFRNLRLAGCRVPVKSWAVQEKYLVPIDCNEFRRTFDNTSQCGNTPPDVEMKPCQGLPLDLRPGDDPGQDFEDAGIGHLHDGRDKSDCFWVCGECRDRSQARYQNNADFMDLSYVQLCQTHSLEHQGFPSNACLCINTAIGDWRCSMCILTSLEILASHAHEACRTIPLRVTLLGICTVTVRPDMEWTAWLLRQGQTYVNKFIPWRVLSHLGLPRRTLRIVTSSRSCPIHGCNEAGWEDLRSMRMCLQCKAIWPINRATPSST
ncbi:hypothetical protein MMC29_004943 [Sticta canariensis]|nr:hypothetical protein [Sticta canariensis]